MLAARPRLDLSQTRFAPLGTDAPRVAHAIFAELEEQAARYFGDPGGARLIFDRKIEMRYAGQEHTVAALYGPEMARAEEMLESFHAAHETAYTFRLSDTSVEMVTFQLGAELDADRVGLPDLVVETTVVQARVGRRELYLGEDVGVTRADVYDRDLLPPGTALDGPVLIEEATATTLVLHEQRVSVDRFGLLCIEEAG